MDISAKNYKNLKWNITTPNKVDTVKFTPMVNLPEQEPVSVYSETITFEDKPPLNIAPQYYRTHYLSATQNAGQHSISRFEFNKRVIEFDIHTEEAIASIPNITFNFRGHSYELRRKDEATHDYVYYNYTDANKSFAQYIHDHAGVDIVDSLRTPFQIDKFPTNAWAWTDPNDRYFSPAPSPTSSWFNNIWYANYENYYSTERNMNTFSGFRGRGTFPWRGGYEYYNLQIQKLNDFEFHVTCELPYRIVGAMAVENAYFIGQISTGYDFDSLLFFDDIEEVDITVEAIMHDVQTVDRIYSIDTRGQLTTQLKNNYPVDLSLANEFFTLNTYKETSDKIWYEELSKEILTKYKNGKYYITLDIKHTYLLQHMIDIDTLLQVKTFDGTYIGRNNVPSTFRVKNIIYKFRADEFICQLYLLEE